MTLSGMLDTTGYPTKKGMQNILIKTCKDLVPVVQNFVSLTSSLKPQLVIIISKCRLHKQIHSYFFVEKCENPLLCKGFHESKDSHIFQPKITVYL